MKKEKISVAIPAHNEAESIQRTLKAVLSSKSKTYDLEIFVCLSACTDNTEKEIKLFKKQNPNTKITVIKCGEGKALAMKKLDSYIKDEVIVFVDADCSPQKDAIYKIHKNLKTAHGNIVLVSGNTIDSRHIDKKLKPISIIDAFNKVFWQHDPRRVVNGSLFAIRKGFIQLLPDHIKLDDVYLSIIFWNNFIKDNKAIIKQGSPQSMFEVVRYQKNILTGKRQLKDHFLKTAKSHYSQFDIKLADKSKYYPNINFSHLITVKFLIFIGKIWASVSTPTWNKTEGSKIIE